MRRLVWAVSSGSTLFDIQTFNFTHTLLFKWKFVKKEKQTTKCRLKFGTERDMRIGKLSEEVTPSDGFAILQERRLL